MTSPPEDMARSAPSVLMVSYSDATGGAARAAYRLLRGLRDDGIDVRMLAMEARIGDPAVEASVSRLGLVSRRALDRLPLHLAMRKARPMFSLAWVPDRLPRQIDRIAPGVVHLQWIGGGMLRLEVWRASAGHWSGRCTTCGR